MITFLLLLAFQSYSFGDEVQDSSPKRSTYIQPSFTFGEQQFSDASFGAGIGIDEKLQIVGSASSVRSYGSTSAAAKLGVSHATRQELMLRGHLLLRREPNDVTGVGLSGGATHFKKYIPERMTSISADIETVRFRQKFAAERLARNNVGKTINQTAFHLNGSQQVSEKFRALIGYSLYVYNKDPSDLVRAFEARAQTQALADIASGLPRYSWALGAGFDPNEDLHFDASLTSTLTASTSVRTLIKSLIATYIYDENWEFEVSLNLSSTRDTDNVTSAGLGFVYTL